MHGPLQIGQPPRIFTHFALLELNFTPYIAGALLCTCRAMKIKIYIFSTWSPALARRSCFTSHPTRRSGTTTRSVPLVRQTTDARSATKHLNGTRTCVLSYSHCSDSCIAITAAAHISASCGPGWPQLRGHTGSGGTYEGLPGRALPATAVGGHTAGTGGHGKANQDEPFPQRLYNQWEEGEYTDQHIIEEHGAAIWYKFLFKRHHRREAQRRLARKHEEWLNRDFSSDTDWLEQQWVHEARQPLRTNVSVTRVPCYRCCCLLQVFSGCWRASWEIRTFASLLRRYLAKGQTWMASPQDKVRLLLLSLNSIARPLPVTVPFWGSFDYDFRDYAFQVHRHKGTKRLQASMHSTIWLYVLDSMHWPLYLMTLCTWLCDNMTRCTSLDVLHSMYLNSMHSILCTSFDV